MKISWLAVLASQFLIILGFWGWNHVHHPMGNQLTGDGIGQMLAYGRLAGLLAACGVLFQLVLIGRLRRLEQAFGLDRLTRLHHVVGFSLLFFISAHLFFITRGHAAQADLSAAAQFAEFIEKWEGVSAAVAAVGIMAGALVFSVIVVLKRIRYEWWYASHLTLYLAIILAFGHQLAVGSDFTDNRWFKYYWLILNLFVLGNLLVYRLGRPLWFSMRHRFIVQRLQSETDDTTSVFIAGRDLARFPVRAGQFFIVRFLAKGFRWEAHPFSVSARPDGTLLRLTIKRLGDFTRRIPNLKPGTRIILDGPYGIFTAEQCRLPKVLLIAGGIGITPIRALAEELARRGRDMLLVYGNRNPTATVFARELDALATATGQLKVVLVMSQDPAWPGEQGQIDQARLARLAPDIRQREVFLCGPPIMMRIVRTALRELGVPRRQIHYERFAL